MRRNRIAPHMGRCEAEKQSKHGHVSLKRYHNILHNAMSKGTAFGAGLTTLLGCGMYEAETPGGLVIAIVSLAYFCLWFGVNHEYL